MHVSNTTSIEIVNDIRVTVPASPTFMTSFVLQEQNDWFEDEIRFVRHFVKPGMKVIDIGANYGLYTLSIAKIVGESGKIWAFEPTEATSACLMASILENKLSNVKLIQSGLSDRLGSARLFTSENSELNSLSRSAASGDQYESIALSTLDHCQQQYGWKHIDFIKLDAEGEESNILKKSKRALSCLSPLIMYELKHGSDINLPLINKFGNMGYSSYRLIPGLNILVKFDPNTPFDDYLLNLFCCKEDKAALLENEGIIVRDWKEKDAGNAALAQEYTGKLAYGGPLLTAVNSRQSDDTQDYYRILNTYIMSMSESASSTDRLGYLMGALRSLRNMLAKGEQRIERMVTFSRIAFDAGERHLGVQILSRLIKRYGADINYEIEELFLPASQRYDGIDPNSKIKEWLFSSILEQYIIKHHYSSYFSRQAALPVFEQLNELGFIDENMRRRHQLVKTCFS
jgi:FkbM family methyltransferase